MTTRFRKRPVEVEAVQWTGDNSEEMKQFTGGKFNAILGPELPKPNGEVYDELHDTWVKVYPGQWVVKGVKGEFYPIAAEVLAETYEPVGVTPCGHPEDHRCFDCATDEELLASLPPAPWGDQ